MSMPRSAEAQVDAVEAVMAEVWESVLNVSDIGPDDDFFALGGDSLLAIQIISAAEQRGLPLKLVDLFERPDLRGSCVNLASGAVDVGVATAHLLDQRDHAALPESVSTAYPMTRLQLGLIYESAASGGSLYVDVVSREVRLPLDVEVLGRALEFVVSRHPILRTRFDLDGYSEPLQLVEEHVTVELELDDLRELSDEQVAARRSETMDGLGRPFALDEVPLLRVHAAHSAPERFRLTYAFHHAILDGWSESVLFFELIKSYQAMLRGEQPSFVKPAPFSEFVRLEREALADERQRQFFQRFDVGPGSGVLRQARRPAPPVPYTVSTPATQPTVDALAKLSVTSSLPLKSLVVASYFAAVEAVFGRGQVAGLSMSGRPEQPGADLTLGLFLNHLPVRLASSGATWRELAQQAFEAERELLPQRRFPYSEVIELVGRRPFDVALNFVHFHNRDQLLAEGLTGVDEDWRDSTSVPIRVQAIYDPQARGLEVVVTVDSERHPQRRASDLAEAVLFGFDRLWLHPDDLVVLAKRDLPT